MPFLIAEVFAANIGGAATLVGDPPKAPLDKADLLPPPGKPVPVMDGQGSGR